MADKDFVVKNGLVVNNFLTVNATTIYVGNDVSNATVNTTIYTGTSNNTSFVGSVSAANVVSNNQLSGNLANYVTLAGLQSNVTKMHANSAVYLGASTDQEGALYIYTNYARYTEPGTFSNNITINGNVVFANVNQTTNNPNYMIVVGNATFQNSVSITGSYLNTSTNNVTFGSALKILPSGNVGIGTATPASMLVVAGNVNITESLTVTNAVTFSNTLSVSGSVTLTSGISAANLTLSTNSAIFGTAAVILPSGNVGIGNTTPADKLSVTGNVAVSSTIKVGTATINATEYSQTANNAKYLGGTIASDFVTTSSVAGVLSSYFNKTTETTVSANAIFAANVTISNGIIFDSTGYIRANGSNGTVGQALLSTETGVKWGSVNTSVIVAPFEVLGNTYIVYNNNGTMAANAAFKFNFSTNTVTIGTSSVNVSINSTAFSGTANNALNLGGSAAADYAKKADVHFIGTTSVALNRSSATQTLTGVSIDGTAANATNLNGIAGSSYQLNSTLSANVATMTSNSTSYVGDVSAANVVSNTQLTANLSNYARLSGTSPITISNTATTLTATSVDGIGVSATSNTNYGVLGVSNTNVGVYGTSISNNGGNFYSNSGVGAAGVSNTSIGIYGTSISNIGGYFFSSTGTGLVVVSNTGVVAQFQNTAGVFAGIYANGNMGIANTTPGSKLTVGGIIEVTIGGVKFPDGSVQTIASTGGGGYYKGNAGAAGLSTNKGNLFRINSNTMLASITISAGENAITTGPITINTGYTLTIETGARAVII